MLVKKDIFNKLKNLGLNSYESRIWVALLSRGVSTAGELSDIANVPRSRSYDVLESLEKKGFIIMKIGKPIKYIAVKPSEVIDRVKKKIEEQTKEQIESLNNVSKSPIIEELKNLYSKGIDIVDPTDLTGAIKGRHNIYTHLESLIKNSEKNIYISTSVEGLNRKMDALKKALLKAKERGVTIKVIVPSNSAINEISKELRGVVEIKAAKDINGRFVIVDGKSTTLMMSSDSSVHPTYDSAIWINSDFIASTFQQMFDRIWKD